MSAYYNEFDPKAAAWLRQLIKNGDISEGVVDERSIIDVTRADLSGFERVHFFAGIGTWDYCLNNAGWRGNVWTASLPCQPFSVAGNQKGKVDERHLLPHFLELVRECRPDTVFGEQVESAIRHEWLDDLQANMEGEGYAVGHCVLGAHSVGKAHIRKRLYWGASRRTSDTESNRDRGGLRQISTQDENQQARKDQRENEAEQCSNVSSDNGVADSSGKGLQGHGESGQANDTEGRKESMRLSTKSGVDSRMDDPKSSRRSVLHANDIGATDGEIDPSTNTGGGIDKQPPSMHFTDIEWLYCRDTKYRPIKSGIKPLVDGIARGVVHSSDSIITPNDSAEARAIRLKGYGNAIVAPVAEEFIKAFMEVSC